MSTVEEEKVADLVLLDKNPLKDITAIRNIYGVVKKGRYYDRAALDGMLKQAISAKSSLDLERK